MAEQKIKSLNLILKADVQGSLEALIKELEKLENAEVPIRDPLEGRSAGSPRATSSWPTPRRRSSSASASPPRTARSRWPTRRRSTIRRYDIIYQVTDEIKKAVEGMLVPEVKEVHLGRAVVRQVFKISKVGTVAGCFVTQGDDRAVGQGPADPRGPRDLQGRRSRPSSGSRTTSRRSARASSAASRSRNFDDLKTDDVIEAYRIDVIRRTL